MQTLGERANFTTMLHQFSLKQNNPKTIQKKHPRFCHLVAGKRHLHLPRYFRSCKVHTMSMMKTLKTFTWWFSCQLWGSQHLPCLASGDNFHTRVLWPQRTVCQRLTTGLLFYAKKNENKLLGWILCWFYCSWKCAAVCRLQRHIPLWLWSLRDGRWQWMEQPGVQG